MNWLNKISNIGLQGHPDIQLVRHVHILNRILLLTCIFICLYILFNFFLHDYFFAYILISFLILMLFSFGLMHLRLFRFTGYYAFILIILIYSVAMLSHNEIGVEYLMIPSSLGAFVVFKRKQDSLFVLAVFILACTAGQVIKFYVSPPIIYSEGPRLILYYFNIFTSFIMSGAIIMSFINVLERYESTLLKQKHTIEVHNKEITDSINYAKRIQLAKLPALDLVQASLKESFVLYKPKDIVSGDFYYFHKDLHTILLAAADCTGHGVPGALMSMIASEKLHDAVVQSSDVSEILSHTNKGIRSSLRQSAGDSSSRDGMDIALCSIDTRNNVLHYAGANRPLWLFREGRTEVDEIKANKAAIGGMTPDEHIFGKHEIRLQKGDTIYICSDGYADQFNSRGKKLTTKHFKNVLSEIQSMPMKDQHAYLNDYIDKWKSGTEQIDDILVIGVRIV